MRWLAAIAILASFSGRCASITVNPIRLEMAAGARATSLVVSNEADEPVLLQAALYDWRHDATGADVLTPAAGGAAPIVTPPLFKLGGRGASQVVRIGFRGAPPAGAEQRWRLIVEEVPKTVLAPEAGAEPPQGQAVAVATRLRISLPLLVPPQPVHKQVSWSLARIADGRLALGADNHGNVTERLDRIDLGAAAAPLASLAGPIYLFPGEHRGFEVKPATSLPAGSVALRLLGTVQPASSELSLSAP